MDDRKLHVYAQPYWHTEAFLVGNRAALLQLAETATMVALGVVPSKAFEATTSDGEGYAVFVTLLPTVDPRWEQLALPYTDTSLFSSTANGLRAFDVVGDEEYRRLHAELRKGE